MPAGAPGPDQEGVFQLLHPSPDIHIRAASMTTAGGNVEWARSAFLPSGSSLQDFDAVVAKTDRGAGGLIYMPHVRELPHRPFAMLEIVSQETCNAWTAFFGSQLFQKQS